MIPLPTICVHECEVCSTDLEHDVGPGHPCPDPAMRCGRCESMLGPCWACGTFYDEPPDEHPGCCSRECAAERLREMRGAVSMRPPRAADLVAAMLLFLWRFWWALLATLLFLAPICL